MPRLAALAALGLLLLPAVARAQLTRETSPVAQPGYGLTTHDGPETVVLDPAAMAFLESWGVGYVHADADGSTAFAGRGDGFYAASPLLFGLSAGLAVDSVRPTVLSGQAERTMISLALGWQTQDALSVGAAVRFLASGSARLQGVTTLDLAASWRPVDWLAMSFQARDVVGPRLGGTLASVPRSFLLGAGLRPFGDRTLTLDLAGALDTNGRVGARLSAELSIPFVGRLLAAAQAEGLDGEDPELRAVAGIAVDWGMVGAGGGARFGDGLEGSPGWYVTGRLAGASREGLPRGRTVVDVELGGLGPRGMVRAVRRLDRALHDDRVAGVLLRPRGSGIGLAYAQEIRLMIDALQAADKRVVCHLDDATGSEWYACAGADAILLDPAGGVRLTGVSTELLLLGDLLRNVGVRADFVRIGRWKSAIEQYMNDAQSAPARRQRGAVLDWAYRRLLHDGATDLEVSRADFAQVVDRGPHLPADAVERGLVTALADELDMDEALREGFGGGYPRERGEPWEVPERWGNRPRIGVVVVDGTLVDGENVDIPILGIHASGGRTVARAIDRMAGDPAVRAIVLRVDSPGGSVMASDQIYRAVVRARRRKPVIASMGAVAASGGYYVAAPAHEIWADPSTITGSIGVWFGKVDFAPLGRMIGVELEQMGRGEHAGATSLYRPFRPDERALLADSVRHWYRSFLRRVARGRGMRVREVDALGRGRLWMGDQAVDNGLVDHLGGLGSALAAARRAAGVGPETDIVVVPSRPASLLDYVLSALGIGAAPTDPVAAEAQAAALERVAPALRAALATVVTMRHLGSGSALALMPQVVVPR
ncbi:MAG TPA: signal peptide peptidase SppA [Sandaracinaceae bacterium LLY-WYZ-13_1]|nr:signal peptide peptidase SppA [Sandaracinaceae bacterium LLY-WYZ-13_1]